MCLGTVESASVRVTVTSQLLSLITSDCSSCRPTWTKMDVTNDPSLSHLLFPTSQFLFFIFFLAQFFLFADLATTFACPGLLLPAMSLSNVFTRSSIKRIIQMRNIHARDTGRILLTHFIVDFEGRREGGVRGDLEIQFTLLI